MSKHHAGRARRRCRVAFGMSLREASGLGRDALVACLSLIVKHTTPVDTQDGESGLVLLANYIIGLA